MKFLFENQKKIYNSLYFKVLFYFFSAFIYAYFAGLSLPDDGLRHIAFAANKDIMHSWGDIFPHSLFFKEYDPWFVWHSIIKFYLHFFSYENVHIPINTTVLFVLMLLLDKFLRRHSKLKESPLILFITLGIVLLSSFRYINIRPDLLSGLFLISALLLNRYFILLLLVTFFYSTTYYLFFLYTGSIGLMYIILKDYRALSALFIGSLFGLIFHFYAGGEYYIKTIIYILSDQSLREGLQVGEGVPLFNFLTIFNYYFFVITLWSISAIIIYKWYDYFKARPLILLLLIMSPLWLIQARYLALLYPLFFLLFVLEVKFILSIFSRHIQYYFYKFFHILKNVQYKTLFLIPALLYTSLSFGYLMQDSDYAKTLKEKEYYKNPLFNNQTILLNSFTIDIYYALYLNPSIKFIPSCAIGWFEKNEKMKDIYIRMMKNKGITEEELNLLLKFVGAKYYLHTMRNSAQVLSLSKLKKLHIIPKLILDNKILFEKEQE